ncbi:MAG: ABC transporter ATP-binding protein, partial [Patescibacteria group bacterium]
MEEKPIIEVRNIGKKYDINHARGGYVSLRDVVANVFKAPFSFLKSKAKQVAGLEKKEEFWALKNVSFSVNRGEVVGIIGANGAGKSTLLKILSQITPPTEGEIILRGRVGSLLEVGTGFHPELSGRENIFLNGAILGMKKAEIEKKFDQIVEFAGIQKFLDTRVKHYSSGMYVRLAFSVAAHMEPDILLVDEVLAVGDAEFQKKCLGKMDEITREEGRTILFVSHNMGAIRQLCGKTLVLNKGSVVNFTETEKAINTYVNKIRSEKIIIPHKNTNREGFKIKKIEFKNDTNKSWVVECFEKIKLEVLMEIPENMSGFRFGLGINSLSGERIFTVHSEEKSLEKGEYLIDIELENRLVPGCYELSLGILNRYRLPGFIILEVENNKNNDHKWFNHGLIDIKSDFVIKK